MQLEHSHMDFDNVDSYKLMLTDSLHQLCTQVVYILQMDRLHKQGDNNIWPYGNHQCDIMRWYHNECKHTGQHNLHWHMTSLVDNQYQHDSQLKQYVIINKILTHLIFLFRNILSTHWIWAFPVIPSLHTHTDLCFWTWHNAFLAHVFGDSWHGFLQT